jgi:sporulation protein YlmC with PRC-barrel domain
MESTKTRGFVRLGDTNLTVADPGEDIRGRTVVDRDGEEIGEVRSLFIDEGERRARFFELESGGILGHGGDAKLIPVEAINEVRKDAVRIDTTGRHVVGSLRFDPELAADERYWHSLYGYYGYSPYWAGR